MSEKIESKVTAPFADKELIALCEKFVQASLGTTLSVAVQKIAPATDDTEGMLQVTAKIFAPGFLDNTLTAVILPRAKLLEWAEKAKAAVLQG